MQIQEFFKRPFATTIAGMDAYSKNFTVRSAWANVCGLRVFTSCISSVLRSPRQGPDLRFEIMHEIRQNLSIAEHFLRKNIATLSYFSSLLTAPCGLRGCKNRPALFPDRMS